MTQKTETRAHLEEQRPGQRAEQVQLGPERRDQVVDNLVQQQPLQPPPPGQSKSGYTGSCNTPRAGILSLSSG